jgi:hypothetical protein
MKNKELLKSVLEQTYQPKKRKGKVVKVGAEIAGGALVAGAAAELGKTGVQAVLKTIKRLKKI